MPLEGAFDIYGSYLTRGLSGVHPDRALRRNLLKVPGAGVPTSADLKTVEDAWIAEQGLFHHVDTTLPLVQLTAQKFGPAKVLLTANYTRISSGGGGGFPNVLVAEEETAVDVAEVYRSSTDEDGNPIFNIYGLPGGDAMVPDLAAQDINHPPHLKRYQRPAARVSVYTTLLFNPFSAVLPLYAHVNAGAVTFAPILGLPNAGPESVLFEGCRVRIRNDGGLIKYDVVYVFLLVQGKFWEQEAKFDTTSATWIVNNRPRFPTASFALAFPYS